MSEAAHAAEGLGIPELPNLLTIAAKAINNPELTHWVHRWQDTFFAGGIILFLGLLTWAASRRATLVPGKLQNFVELLVEGLVSFCEGILGPEYGRRFAPFLGTLFLYIWVMNLSALIPGYRSATANLNTTAGLALCVFIYVQATAFRLLGVKGYFHHMVGSPDSAVSWVVGLLLIFPVHLMGEFIKPMSLSLRLFGNITGEDALMASFVQMGLGGLPLQLFAKGLALIFSTIQALVFTTLTAIYLALVLPHHEAEGHAAHH